MEITEENITSSFFDQITQNQIGRSNKEDRGPNFKRTHSLSHWPWRAAAERGKMLLLLLDFKHQHQAGILVLQVVKQERHEVVDDICLIALSASVHINCYIGVFQCNPLKERKYE